MNTQFQKKRGMKLFAVILTVLIVFTCLPSDVNAYCNNVTDKFTVHVVGKNGSDVQIGQWTFDAVDGTLEDGSGNEADFITHGTLVYSGQDSYTSCARIAVATKYIELNDLLDYAVDTAGFAIGNEASIAFKAADAPGYGDYAVIGNKYGLDRYYYPSYIMNQSYATEGGIVPTVLAITGYNVRNNTDPSKGITPAAVIVDDSTLADGIAYLEGKADDERALRLMMGQLPDSGTEKKVSTEMNLGGESLYWISDVRLKPVYYDISVVTNGAVTVTMDDGYFKAAGGESVSFTLSNIPSGKKVSAAVKDAANHSYSVTKSGSTYSFTMPATSAAINLSLTDSAVWDGTTVDVSWYNGSSSTFSISTPDQLMGLAAIVNGGVDSTVSTILGNGGALPAQDSFAGKTVRLTADLDMGGVYNSATGKWSGPNYMPIGGQWRLVTGTSTDGSGNTTYTYASSWVGNASYGASFCGIFDGNGHMVKNINCVREVDSGCEAVGLIGRLGRHDNETEALRPVDPAVRNVGVTGYIQGGRSIGGIVGKTGKTAYNNTVLSPAGIGASIENCINYATVYAEQKKGVGGIVGAGWNGGVIQNCINMGSVSNKNSNPTGGIAGSLEYPAKNCYNAGAVSAATASYAMALGTIDTANAAFVNCYWLDGSAAGAGVFKSTARDSVASKSAIEMKSAEFVALLNVSGSAFSADTTNINSGYPILSWQKPADSSPVDENSGGGGGGGGGIVPAEQKPEIAKDAGGGQRAVAVTETTAKTDTAGKAVASVTSNTLSSALKSAQEAAAAADSKAGNQSGTTGIEVKVEVKAVSNAKAVETSLPPDALKAMAKQENTMLTVSSPVAEITLDQDALAAIVGAAGSQVTISAEKVDKGSLPEAAKAAVGDAPVYDLKVLSANGTISDFKDGKATVSVPYELKTGESAAQVAVYYINSAGELVKMNCSYDSAAKTARFTTDHFSYYAVMIDDSISFTDVKQTAYYYDAVSFAVKKGLFNGTTETTFNPNAGMTRAMFVTVLGRASGINPADYTPSGFLDVNAGSWYGGYVQWAYENKIISGMSSDLFGSEQLITRAQMAAILTNYSKWKGTAPANTAQAAYSDLASIPDWAAEGVGFCSAKGWFTGYPDGSFKPQKTATRAEAATLLFKGSGSGLY